MQEDIKLDNLIKMSHEIGDEIAYVQGGGGNTSVKLDDERMAIKASGIPLKFMNVEGGFSVVNYEKVNKYHCSPDFSEDKYSESIASFSINSNAKPSIETGFHALLGEYVIHSHSVFLNVLLCAKEGKDLILEYFPESIWVDYHTPGKDLTLAIKKLLRDREDPFEGLIFLESHGVIVSSRTYQRCLEIHDECNSTVKALHNLKDFNILNEVNFTKPENFLFPDQVIYMSSDQLKAKTKASVETISTAEYLHSSMSDQMLTPRYLSKKNVDILNNMQSEKYRKRLSK